MFSADIHHLAEKVIRLYTRERLKIVTAESCTAGLIAGALTDIPGSSAVLERGFITYSNYAKVEVLAVMPETLEQFGAVSARVAEEMAQGALDFSRADVAISVTGIAGPDGGSAEKPVGLVWFGLATRQGALMHYKCNFTGNRENVRMQAMEEAMKLVLTVAGERD
jgi:nicotinamide-nucleotide amidase